MKKFLTPAVIFVLTAVSLILVEGCKEKKAAVQPGKTGSMQMTSAEPTSFNEVTSKLDAGGNLYFYLGTEQWLTNLSTFIGNWRQPLASMSDANGERQQIENAFNIVTRVVKDSGLEDVSGVGLSSIAREPGLYHNKLIVHHYAGRGNGFIWTMFGKEPHELTGLDFLPANTAMAAFYDLDAEQLWSVIQKQCEQSGFPQATEALNEFQQQFQKNAGLKWDDVVDSLGGEFGIVVTLNDAKSVTIPLPTHEPLDIPEPGFMLVMKVKNDTIFNRLDELIKKTAQQGSVRVDEKDLKMRTVPVPIPLPMTLRPSIATSGGYFFFATSDALIREALAVKGGKAGLKSTDEFKKLAADVPEQGNQFCFMSERFGQTVAKIQQQTLAMNQQAPPQMRELMRSLLQSKNAAFTFGVGANTDEGWMAVANGSQGGGNILAASAAVPAVLAAIALPNFAKAKETSQKNTCINNLRMIEGAKQQWALANNKSQSDIPSWEDIKVYLGRGKGALRCPQGGEYTIGAVGELATCSIPGHALQLN
jgi:hypothetical protein